MPNDPPTHERATLHAMVDAVFGDEGTLAQSLPGYEPREGQRRMAAAVAEVIAAGGVLLAEAGTGTGKTLAYLAPAILSGQRVLVSTGTKNLQEQVFFKDLPSLREALPVPFTATLMKGRANYLCLHRFEQYRQGLDGHPSSRLIDTSDRVLLPILEEWVATTETGDRAELRDLPEDLPLWKEVAVDAETCLGTECPRHAECFVTRMRQRAAESDVVIVNHHLLCADAAVRQGAYGEVIPSCPTLVIDEAHQLEDIATQYFGLTVSNYQIDEMQRDTERVIGSAPIGVAAREETRRALARLADHSRAFFSGITMAVRAGAEGRVRYTAETFVDHVPDGAALAGVLDGLEAIFGLMLATGASGPPAHGSAQADEAKVRAELAALQRRAGALRQALTFLVKGSDPEFVFFLELRGRGQGRGGGVFLRAAPVDVSATVRDAIVDRMRTTVLTSATLSVDGSFDYVRDRLGVGHADELRVRSEFDYASQAILYLPRSMPSPRSPQFAEAVAREVLQILRNTQGRAFVLFTSYAVMRTVQQILEMTLPYPILVQGSAPRTALIDQFRATPHAVLLATSSFWQGVDVVGKALSCVIIDKLPFASPVDPITAARMEAVTARGGDPFSEYQVPLAILALQQGLGRLIRHRSDRGVLAVLDPRLRTMPYGRRFLASLPPAPVTMELQAVEKFLERHVN